ncbi:hypothetical protein C4K23_3111 [Pseudomonas chlororaphis]|nr:hypothetical protein C4K23_3111 [Pseudomonas chlororaphis]
MIQPPPGKGSVRGVESRRSAAGCEMPFCSKLIIKLTDYLNIHISVVRIL